MKKAITLAFVSLAFALSAFGQAAQTKAPSSDPFESGWNVSVGGNFANVTNAANNNGFQTVEELRVAQHWSARSDQFLTLNPGAVIATAGPEYRLSLAHILSKSNFAANASKFEAFADIGAGTARSSATDAKGTSTLSAAHFAYKVGGGFDYLLSNNVWIRPLDISYVRAPMLQNGGAVLGNQLQFAAGLGIRF